MFKNNRLNLIIVIGFAFCALLFSNSSIKIDFINESGFFLNAQRILSGQFPYKDFFSTEAPGMFYLYSALVKLFGVDYAIGRNITIFFHLSNSILILFLTYKLAPARLLNIIPALLYACISALLPHFNDSLPIGLFFNLLSALFLYTYFEKPKVKTLMLAGFVLGVGAIFRHDLATFIYGAQFWSAFFYGIHKQKDTDFSKLKKALLGFREGVYYSIGFFIPVIPVFLVLVNAASFAVIWDYLFFKPLYSLKPFSALAFPNPFVTIFSDFSATISSITFYIPLAIVLTCLIYIILATKKKNITPNMPFFWAIWFLFNLVLNFYNIAISRSNLDNTYPAIAASLLIIHGLLFSNYQKVFRVVAFVAALSYMSFISLNFYMLNENSKRVLAYKNTDQTKLIANYIKANSSTGQNIMILGTPSNQSRIADRSIYLQCDRAPASAFDELRPGVICDTNIQKRIIGELTLNASFIIIDKRYFINENNKSSEYYDRKIIDNYIQNSFISVLTLDSFEILKKVR